MRFLESLYPKMEEANGGDDGGGQGGGVPPPAGGDAKPWYGEVAPETKGVIEMKGWSKLDDVVQGYSNLEKLRGVPADRLLTLPAALSDKADEAAKKAHEAEYGKIYDRLGRPEKPEGYKLPFKDDGKFSKEASTWFHEAGLSAAQAQKLAAKWEAYGETMGATMTQQREAATLQQQNEVKSKWGGAYEKNIQVASGAMKMLGLDEAKVNALEGALGWGGVMELLHGIGSKIGEDKFISGDSAVKGSMTPDEARARITALKNDGAWVQKYLAGGTVEKAEMERLQHFAVAGG